MIWRVTGLGARVIQNCDDAHTVKGAPAMAGTCLSELNAKLCRLFDGRITPRRYFRRMD